MASERTRGDRLRMRLLHGPPGVPRPEFPAAEPEKLRQAVE